MSLRLGIEDAVALHRQTTTAPAHTVAVLVMERSEELSHPRLQELLASSLPRLARFRSRLVGKPMGVGQPLWAEIDSYDPMPQIHGATVRAPGGRRELAELVMQLSAGMQDWRRSLWQAWSIDGLAGGRWALAVKMSPVLCDDGYGLAALWQQLITSEPISEYLSPPEAGLGPGPSRAALVADTLAEVIENQVIGAWLVAEAAAGAVVALRRQLYDAADPPVAPRRPGAGRPFTGPLTRRRSTALAAIPLADVQTISDAFGGSARNVVLAACTLALRSWLLRYDRMPDDPLVLTVPLATPDGDAAEDGCAPATGQIMVPVHTDDPVQVLSNLHTATERLHSAHRYPERPAPLITLMALLPPWLTHAGMQAYSRFGLTRLRPSSRHGAVAFASQRPGPMYCAGADVVAMYSVAPLAEGCGLNVGIIGHGDVLDVCVTACPDNVPDVEYLCSGITDAIDVLVRSATKSPRGEGRSVVSELNSHASRRS
ncbi:wax ester/triacylglycerol synthase domain-containing protein [Mycobacterium sp. IDR2000157661]|uniref:wax ester/triacylglycerol synthase domain-containing protein n=1 Tax=Mycobacterium sp. IDR2000157661 TaxID=2867005 RepID=UPI001EEB090B|nr:wax ester/triacylglycerol synthase domain-containing protein [Mycobacterium sp. IDR2000157661]ULE34006.1 WS/DGAT domain-containing protein [Mycobacterium sp. IDR2000157661]